MKLKHSLLDILDAMGACEDKLEHYVSNYPDFETAWWDCTDEDDLFFVVESVGKYLSDKMYNMLLNAYSYAEYKSFTNHFINDISKFVLNDSIACCDAIRGTIALRTVQIAINKLMRQHGLPLV